MSKELPRLSVVCVYNDPAVRQQCLDGSLMNTDKSLVEYLPIDNVGQVFTSAGAALNHGARMARYEVVVLVHQDVYLHSVQRLRELAAHLTDEKWGLIGACGVDGSGTVVGTLRDRVQLIGVDTQTPADVDSVDEVLFMARRDRLLQHPLSEAPELSWHAYAVEYGARMRRLGLRVGAGSAAITHNSLTINLARLDDAHAFVAATYPEQVPLRTTCGTIGAAAGGRLRNSAFVQTHGWRKRWLSESALALRAGRHSTSRWPVLADIRIDVDTLAWPEHAPLHVVNLDPNGAFSDRSGPVTLSRAGREVRFAAARDVPSVARLLVEADDDASHLITNLAPGDVRTITARLPSHRASRFGVHERDVWLLTGPVAELPATEWSQRRAIPLLAGV